MASVDDFASQLEDFGDSLSNLDEILLSIGGQVVSNMKANAPVDSGSLKNSIQAVVTQNTLQIEMLAYGLFQNYGVDGMQQRVADDVPFGIDPQPAAGKRYGFSGDFDMIGGDLSIAKRKSIYAFGLKPQRWFDLQQLTIYIETEVARRLVEEI